MTTLLRSRRLRLAPVALALLSIGASPALAGLRLYVEKANHAAHQVYRAMGMSPDHYDLYEWLK